MIKELFQLFYEEPLFILICLGVAFLAYIITRDLIRARRK